MFKKKISNIGSTEAITFHNQDNSYAISLIPTTGALVSSLILNGQDIIDGPANEEEIKQNNAYKSTFLAPFPNRINNGKFSFDGNKFQLPINEGPNNNALHGLVYNKLFEITSEELEADQVTIKLVHHYDGHNAGYPFPFTMGLTLILSEKNGFQCTFEFTNQTDHDLPFGYGWHPYFTLGGEVDEWELQFPVSKHFEVDSRMIPTGKTRDMTAFSQAASLKDVNLDDCFEILDLGGICDTTLTNKKGFGITLWQETGDKKLNFLQIYTPPHRKSIAIEPQSACIDAFNNGFGLFKLANNEAIRASFGIRVK